MSSKSPIIDPQSSKRLVLVMEYLNVSQVEMAKICKISQPMISKICAGNKDIPQSVIKFLFTEKNISPAFIIAGVGGIEYKREKETLIKDIRSLREDMEIMKAQIRMLTTVINELKGK